VTIRVQEAHIERTDAMNVRNRKFAAADIGTRLSVILPELHGTGLDDGVPAGMT